MRIVVLEDERPALEELLGAIASWSSDVEILAVIESVAGAIGWLKSHPAPDLILADIQLTDGRALEVFEQLGVVCPVVFVTAYDEFTMNALESGGIDYLLKPVEPSRVARALDKVVALREHFAATEHRRAGLRRLLVRRASAVVAIELDEVAWFCTDHRLVFLVTKEGDRYVIDKTLTALVSELPERRFFRIGRSWIVSLEAIRGFRSCGKGRLALRLIPSTERPAIVSAELAPSFKTWLAS